MGLGPALTANADDIQFLLLGGTTQKLTFTGGKSGVVLLQLGTCNKGLCDWAEQGKGSVSVGQNPLAGYSGLWSFSIPYSGNNKSNITLTAGFNGDPRDFSVTQPSPITFDWGTAGCTGASCLLTGNLELLDLIESGGGATFNLGLSVNLTITGGMLASLVGANDILNYTIAFSGPVVGGRRTASGTSGSAGSTLMATSELGSLVLLGTGVAFLALMRRRQRHTAFVRN